MTPITLTSYDVGTLLALKGFAAAMLGGMGNPLGAVIGGLIVGLLEAFSAGYSRRPTRTRSRSSSSSACCSRCRKACSAAPRSSASDACSAHASRSTLTRAVVAARRDRASSLPLIGLDLDVLSAHRGARLHLRARGRRAQSADGLCRTGQPRPCGLLRHRRLCGRGRADASRRAVLGRADRRRGDRGRARVPGRPADPEAERPLPRGRDARPRPPDRDGVHQRGALHRRTGRHAGAAARAVRLARAHADRLVLDLRRHAGRSAR